MANKKPFNDFIQHKRGVFEGRKDEDEILDDFLQEVDELINKFRRKTQAEDDEIENKLPNAGKWIQNKALHTFRRRGVKKSIEMGSSDMEVFNGGCIISRSVKCTCK